MRTKQDCIFLSSVIAKLNIAQLSLLFGLLCGAYCDHPDTLFWHEIEKFQRVRFSVEATIGG